MKNPNFICLIVLVVVVASTCQTEDSQNSPKTLDLPENWGWGCQPGQKCRTGESKDYFYYRALGIPSQKAVLAKDMERMEATCYESATSMLMRPSSILNEMYLNCPDGYSEDFSMEEHSRLLEDFDRIVNKNEKTLHYCCPVDPQTGRCTSQKMDPKDYGCLCSAYIKYDGNKEELDSLIYRIKCNL